MNGTGVVPCVQLPRRGLLHFPLVFPAAQPPPQFPIRFGESEESDWWGSGGGSYLASGAPNYLIPSAGSHCVDPFNVIWSVEVAAGDRLFGLIVFFFQRIVCKFTEEN